MIRLEVSKYNKNCILHFEDGCNYAELTEFQNDLMLPFRDDYLQMLKIYNYLPIDCNAMGHEVRKVWERNSNLFKYIKREEPDINTFIFYYEKKKD